MDDSPPDSITGDLMNEDKPGPEPDISDAEIVEYIITSEVPVSTVSEVAETGGISTTAARKRLERLVEKNALQRKETGATVVYYPDCYEAPSLSD
jgi:predicted transcriptional regulator